MAVKSMRTFVLIIGILLVILAAGSNYYLSSPSDTPELAIRKFVFADGNPIESFNIDITPTTVEDNHYGKQFVVDGYYDNDTGMEVMFFYLMKSDQGWYVTSAGTGP